MPHISARPSPDLVVSALVAADGSTSVLTGHVSPPPRPPPALVSYASEDF